MKSLQYNWFLLYDFNEGWKDKYLHHNIDYHSCSHFLERIRYSLIYLKFLYRRNFVNFNKVNFHKRFIQILNQNHFHFIVNILFISFNNFNKFSFYLINS